MVLASLLLKEKVIKITELRRNPEKILKGFIRVVTDSHGLKTSGFFMDKGAFLNLLEAIQYSRPEFWDELEKSRKSGRVPAEKIEKRLGLA